MGGRGAGFQRGAMSKGNGGGSQPQQEKNSPRHDAAIFEYSENDVEYNEVGMLDRELSEEEIIQRLAGGDMTKGSCASMALAYIGNKMGYDVLDFRGGDSQRIFSTSYYEGSLKKMITKEPALAQDLITVEAASSMTAGNQILKKIESGKEYLMSVGGHAAIVRKTESGYQYLELQSSSAKKNGWTSFGKSARETIAKRFGNKKALNLFGIKVNQTAYLIDIDSFKKYSGFKETLGYLNTAEGQQQKGGAGYAK